MLPSGAKLYLGQRLVRFYLGQGIVSQVLPGAGASLAVRHTVMQVFSVTVRPRNLNGSL